MLEEEVIDTTKRKGTKVTFIRMKLFLKIQIPLWVRNQDGEELLLPK
jgi:hypothetical protein